MCSALHKVSLTRVARHSLTMCAGQRREAKFTHLSSFRNLQSDINAFSQAASPLRKGSPRKEESVLHPALATASQCQQGPHLGRDCSLTEDTVTCSVSTYQLKAEVLLPPDLHIDVSQDSDEPAMYHVTRWATFCFHVPCNFFSLRNTQSICSKCWKQCILCFYTLKVPRGF